MVLPAHLINNITKRTQNRRIASLQQATQNLNMYLRNRHRLDESVSTVLKLGESHITKRDQHGSSTAAL